MLNVIAVIIGILHSVRRLDVTRRHHEDYPHVSATDFQAWREQERRVYTVGSSACFLKVLVGAAFVYFAADALPWTLVRIIGASIDIGWLGALVWAWVAGARARRRREELGIVLGPGPRKG